jgi:hypothetical protein
MSAKKANRSKRTAVDPQAMAHAVVDRYFAALAADLPYDTAPGGIELVTAASEIKDVIEARQRRDGIVDDDGEDAALRAGYLIGVEVGRRIGGAR